MKAIFTNDDAGARAGQAAVDAFGRVVDWLSSCGIRATFFWVPKPRGKPTNEDDLWMGAAGSARDKGHDFQLHGLTHGSCLEFGVPQESTRRANARPFEEYEKDRGKWQQEHAPDSLHSKLDEAVTIYRRAFGEPPVVFRSPCFGVCPGMYEALARVGIRHSSSRGINPTATSYTILGDRSLRRWAPDFPCRPFHEAPGVMEIPSMEDLAIAGVPSQDFEDRLDLFKSELGHVIQEVRPDRPLVFASHYHSMVRTWEQTRDLYQRLLDWLAQQGVSEWVTFKEAITAGICEA